MHKVWDQMTAFLKWGWPLPKNTLYKEPKVEIADQFFKLCESGKGHDSLK